MAISCPEKIISYKELWIWLLTLTELGEKMFKDGFSVKRLMSFDKG